ncbi:hypothetical protein IFM89_025733 [Coptis chinensis]|uniref:arginine--tRNA ligase n=1 Tax=Coptis chinensis TaxID=261450 RepID=A0A835I6L0_9MAGN|nr:hypothetical protein IFM89_025733 [Coptis chinensis]
MEEDNGGSLKKQISKLFEISLKKTLPDTDVDPLVVACTAKFGDYQCNNAMSLWALVKGKSTQFKGPPAIGQAIRGNLPKTEMIQESSVAGPGFVNIVLSSKWIAKSIEKMLKYGIEIWAPRLNLKTAVVDFSSPNIAKEMHVGHLRSTIIGDALARMLEFSNVNVLRRNHVGDWGTQFGMLIEFLFDQFPNWEEVGEQAIGDLQVFYKKSKQRFDNDPDFKERAQRAVVQLQGGEENYRRAWAQICEISRREFNMVYQRLGVELEEKGESFYNPYIPGVLEGLSEKGLIEESEGAQVIFFKGKKVPLIVVKSDGGYNYASTDLAALWYRLNDEKAEWIIYVTDVGQQGHFEMVFSVRIYASSVMAFNNFTAWSRRYSVDNSELEIVTSTKPSCFSVCCIEGLEPVGFGLVLGDDGKRFRTRASEVVRLVDLLDEAKNRSKAALVGRGKAEEWTDEELKQTAEAVGYGAVK